MIAVTSIGKQVLVKLPSLEKSEPKSIIQVNLHFKSSLSRINHSYHCHRRVENLGQKRKVEADKFVKLNQQKRKIKTENL